MEYLSYEEYVEMGGELEKQSFSHIEFKARKTIDFYTQGRLIGRSEVDMAVKMLVFELIKLNEADCNIISADNDGVSVTYADSNSINKKEQRLIKKYLTGLTASCGAPLLYAGVC